MTSIYLSYLIRRTLPASGLAGLGSALGRIRPGLDEDHFSFSDRKPSNSMLGPAKVPQTGVAFVNMTAPAGFLPSTVSTPKLEGLFLPRCVFVWSRRCGVSINKALKEWQPSKKVLNSANIVSWDRRGVSKLSNALCLHSARGLKAKILKSTEKNHVIQTNLFLENAKY